MEKNKFISIFDEEGNQLQFSDLVAKFLVQVKKQLHVENKINSFSIKSYSDDEVYVVRNSIIEGEKLEFETQCYGLLSDFIKNKLINE